MSERRGTGGPPPPHRFGEGEPFSVGLEEELLLVDADTLALAHVADQVLPRTGLPRERLDHEAFLAEVEVRSEPRGLGGARRSASLPRGAPPRRRPARRSWPPGFTPMPSCST